MATLLGAIERGRLRNQDNYWPFIIVNKQLIRNTLNSL